MSESEVTGSDIFSREKLIFEQGKKYFISAGSGKGKTSALNFIYGCNLNYDGKVLFDGSIRQDSDPSEIRKNKLSYVFQDFRLFPSITLYDNIQLKNKLTNYKSKKEIMEMVKQVGLYEKRNSLLKNLSLGQRQRVAIIRSLCQPFNFLLMDEPFSHLDDANINILRAMITEEVSARQAGMILTSLGNDYGFGYDKILNL